MVYYRTLLLIAGLSLTSASVLAATSTSTTQAPMVNSNGEINKQAVENNINQRIKNNDVTQQGTGIMKIDPDTVVAASVAGQNNGNTQPLKPGQTSPTQPATARSTSGVANTQSQQMLNSLDTSATSNPILQDPDVAAAQQAATSVNTAPSAVNNPNTTSTTTATSPVK